MTHEHRNKTASWSLDDVGVEEYASTWGALGGCKRIYKGLIAYTSSGAEANFKKARE